MNEIQSFYEDDCNERIMTIRKKARNTLPNINLVENEVDIWAT